MNRALFTTAFIALLATATTPSVAADGAQTVLATPSALRTLAPYRTLIEAKGEVSIVSSPRGTGRIVLDVLDGKAAAAAVSMPLVQAVEAARVVAWEEGRLLIVPETIEFSPVPSLSTPDAPVGFVTAGAVTPSLKGVFVSLR